jgi:hypothetical protein
MERFEVGSLCGFNLWTYHLRCGQEQDPQRPCQWLNTCQLSNEYDTRNIPGFEEQPQQETTRGGDG